MQDKNGKWFTVGDVLQSVQSRDNAGMVECIRIEGKTAYLSWFDGLSPTEFPITQNSLNTSKWVVVKRKEQPK